MRIPVVLVALLAAVGATSCAGKTQTPRSARGELPEAKAQPTNGPQPATPAAPAIPPGAEWTIYCATLPGVGHIQQSSHLRDRLVQTTGMRDWYVVHGENDSTLYYGFFKTIDKNAKATREKIDAMTDASGSRPFRNALIVDIAPPDPDAPPQWNLANAPPGMAWSLQIAAYEGSPERKNYAVQAVRDARAQGVPAFFYHGPTVSSVCIGMWPREAVRGDLEPAFNDPAEHRPAEQLATQQGGDVIVVAPGLPPVNREFRTKHGKVRAVSAQLEPVDPTLLAAMKNYPNHYLNGEAEGMRTKQGVAPKPSFLVKIPRRSESLFGSWSNRAVAGSKAGSDLGASDPMQPPAHPPTERPAPQPGYGRLRSLGDN